MNRRDEWLADTLQKVGLGLFLGAFLKADNGLEGLFFLISGLGTLFTAYLLTSDEERPK